MAIVDDDWTYNIIDSNLGCDGGNEFESRALALYDDVLHLSGFNVKNYSNTEISSSTDEELKMLIEKNKQLRIEIDKKIEELTQQKSQYENYKRDQKLLSEEIKDTHEAFLMAKKYYKKYLNMYYTIETKVDDKQTIFIQFFTDAKKESDKYSVRLLRDLHSGHYELLDTNPKMKQFEEWKKILQCTNDTPSVLSSIRQAFLKKRKNKD